MKQWLLKLHRWAALIFAAPLAVVIVTGLILSVEPGLVAGAIKPDSLTAAKVEALIGQHDPNGRAREIAYRSYDNTLTFSAGRGGGTVIDAASGEAIAGPSALTRMLVIARRMHENLLLNAGWLVAASTAAMLVLSLLGVFMGLPRISNSLSGWHKAMAWGTLPLIILSPLTGLMLAMNITLAGPPAEAARAAPVSLVEAVRIVGVERDLSTLVWLRPQGGRMLARLVDENGKFAAYAVTRDGLVEASNNWPRLWHEGNFAGVCSAAMNVIISLAMLGLLVTGPWIWLRRRHRQRARRRAAMAPA